MVYLHYDTPIFITNYNQIHQSQPNTPTLVSWEVVFLSANTTNYNYKI